MGSLERHILHNVKRASLADVAAQQIRRAIKEGRFLPGQRLPSERRLSGEMGISRPILRESLRELAAEGYVRIQAGSGNFVAEINQWPEGKPHLWLQENRQLLHDFYEARLAIEPTCAALAATRGTDDEIILLQQRLAEAGAFVADQRIQRFVAMDIDFHAMIAGMARNTFLFKMLDAIIRPETDLRNVLHRLPQHLAIAHERHKRIVEAIAARDPEAARKAMHAALIGPSVDIQESRNRGNQEETL